MHNDLNALQLNFMLAVHTKCNSILVRFVTQIIRILCEEQTVCSIKLLLRLFLQATVHDINFHMRVTSF